MSSHSDEFGHLDQFERAIFDKALRAMGSGSNRPDLLSLSQQQREVLVKRRKTKRVKARQLRFTE